MKKAFQSTFLVLCVLAFATGCATTNTADTAGTDATAVGTAPTTAEDTASDGTSMGADRGDPPATTLTSTGNNGR